MRGPKRVLRSAAPQKEENMPELPEVETIRRVLAPQLAGRTIGAVTLTHAETAAHPSAAAFCAALPGRRILSLGRRGKYLSLQLDRGELVVHLRMTGSLQAVPQNWPALPYTQAVLALSGGWKLRFDDQRRFGRLWLLAPGEADTFTGRAALGPEPFDPALTGAYLARVFGQSRRAVKSCLLDQSAVAGIGNIYSDEILFAARLHPARAACTLSAAEWDRLAAAIPARLAYFIDCNAVTPEQYRAMRGREYRNTPFLQMYGHAGAPCPVCGATLCRAVIGGRSSVSCPHCQPAPAQE